MLSIILETFESSINTQTRIYSGAHKKCNNSETHYCLVMSLQITLILFDKSQPAEHYHHYRFSLQLLWLSDVLHHFPFPFSATASSHTKRYLNCCEQQSDLPNGRFPLTQLLLPIILRGTRGSNLQPLINRQEAAGENSRANVKM